MANDSHIAAMNRSRLEKATDKVAVHYPRAIKKPPPVRRKHHEELIQPDVSGAELRIALANTPAQPERFNKQDILHRIEQRRLKNLAQDTRTPRRESEQHLSNNTAHCIFVYQTSPEAHRQPEPIDHTLQIDGMVLPGPEPSIDEDLDELDREILQLPERNKASEGASHSLQNIRLLSRSPKRPRESALRNLSNSYDVRYQADNSDVEQPPSKKQQRPARKNVSVEKRDAALRILQDRRTSKYSNQSAGVVDVNEHSPEARQKKKQPRRLPVEELIHVSERLGDPDLEADDDEPIELSEDPISQQSTTMRRFRLNTVRRLQADISFRVKVFRGRGLNINISEFRFPKTNILSSNSRYRFRSKFFHADGFEGREANPIGRTMPIRHSRSRQDMFPRITLRMGELKLVAERPVEAEYPPLNRPREVGRPRNIRKLEGEHSQDEASKSATKPRHEETTSENCISAGDQKKLHVDKDNHAPNIATSGNTYLLTSMTTSSPPKRKPQHYRRVMFHDEAEKRLLGDSAQEGSLKQVNCAETTSFQQVRRVFEKPWKVKEKDEVSTSQRLMMVTLPRSNLSVDESDYDYSDESEETDEDSENLLIETYLPVGEDLGDKRDIELEDELEGEETEVKLVQLGEAGGGQKHTSHNFHNSQVNHRYQNMDDFRERNHQKRTSSGTDDPCKPRKLRSSTVVMEVDEDIIDSPLTSHQRHKPSRSLSYPTKCTPRIGSRPPVMARSKRPNPIIEQPPDLQTSQGSAKLGGIQRFAGKPGPSCGSETRPDIEPLEPVEETPDQKRSLHVLTRQASIGLGTIPKGVGKRLMSLPFAPPFKRI